MESCSRCEELPDTKYDSGSLYLSPPFGHTFQKVRQLLEGKGVNLMEPFEDIIGIDLEQIDPQTLAQLLEDALKDAEIDDTKSLHVEKKQEISISHLAQMKPLSQYLGEIRGHWIAEAIREGRFFSMFQPIIKLEGEAEFETHGYECLLRSKHDDGEMISPAKIFGDARRANLNFLLDRHARITSISEAAKHQIEEKIFINFLPSSIYDPEYCLRTTVNALENTSIANDQIVFEVVETERIKDREQLTDILNYYREKEFKIALDDLGAGYSSLGLLKDLKPDYMKIDFDLVNGVSRDSYRADIAKSLIEMSHKNDIQVIAEGIESVNDMEWFRENGADFGQGFFFARPDQPPPLPRQVPQGI